MSRHGCRSYSGGGRVLLGGLRLGLFFLAIFLSTGAQAFCVTCVAMVAVGAQQTAIAGALVAFQNAVVAAIGAKGGGDASSKQGEVAAEADAAKSRAEAKTAVAMRETYHQVRAENTINTQSVNCRMQTMNNMASTVTEKFEQSVAFNLQDGVINLFFSQNFNPVRTRVATLQRNCKNGQMRRGDLGESWWNAVNAASPPQGQCFEDATDLNGDGVPDFAHAFLSPTTVLDNRVMVPPSNANMARLNDPNGAGAVVQTVWTGLNRKQKIYVSAVRFCENLALYALRPLGIYGDAAMAPQNQQIILQNFAAIGKLDALVYACRSEVARRTAPDAAALVAAGFTEMQGVADDAAKAGELLRRTGVNPAEFAEGATTYVSPALLSYARTEAFCNNNETAKSIYADTGTDSEKTTAVLRCEQLKMTNRETEQIYRSLFNSMVAGVGGLQAQFVDGVAAPLRAEAEGRVEKASLVQRPAPRNLLDLLKE